jgi:hypothetical protein
MKEKLVLGKSLDEAAYNYNKEAIRNLQENPGKVGTLVKKDQYSKSTWDPQKDYVNPAFSDVSDMLSFSLVNLIKRKRENPELDLVVDNYPKFKSTLIKQLKRSKARDEILAALTQDIIREEPYILKSIGKEQSGNVIITVPSGPEKMGTLVYLDPKKLEPVGKLEKVMKTYSNEKTKALTAGRNYIKNG